MRSRLQSRPGKGRPLHNNNNRPASSELKSLSGRVATVLKPFGPSYIDTKRVFRGAREILRLVPKKAIDKMRPSDAEVERFLNTVRRSSSPTALRDWLLLRLIRDTGVKLKDMIKLRVSDIDFKRVAVRNGGATYGISVACAAGFGRYLSGSRPSGYAFASPQGGEMHISTSCLRKALMRYRKEHKARGGGWQEI